MTLPQPGACLGSMDDEPGEAAAEAQEEPAKEGEQQQANHASMGVTGEELTDRVKAAGITYYVAVGKYEDAMKLGWDGVEPPSPTEEASPPTRQMEGGLQADAAEKTLQVKQLPGQKRRAQSLGDSRPHALQRYPSVARLQQRQSVTHALEAPSWFAVSGLLPAAAVRVRGCLANDFPDAPPMPHSSSIGLGQLVSSGGTLSNVFMGSDPPAPTGTTREGSAFEPKELYV